MLSPSGNDQKDLLREAHRLAKDAIAVLEPNISKQKDPLRQIALREALIASLFAYGHVASQVLPDYRDDAWLAFAAAFDEMARLPFHKGNLKIMGSPMITAMANRKGDSGAKLAFEERRYRELVTRFLEGMYTLQFENADAAADQMATALRLSQQSGGDPGQSGPRDAAVMLGQTDGFDAQVTLHDTVRAFKILADVKADRHEAALLGAVRLLVPGVSVSRVQDVDQQMLEKAVQRIQSPLRRRRTTVRLKHPRSRSRKGAQPRGTPSKPPKSTKAQKGQASSFHLPFLRKEKMPVLLLCSLLPVLLLLLSFV